MILDRHQKWCFISTMKCATNSLYKALPGMPLWDVTGDFHARPAKRLARTHFTVVRNPYDRAVSIWASTCMREGDRHGAKALIKAHHGNPEDFEDFCRFCLVMDPEHWAKVPWLFKNQTDWIDTFLCDRVARMESLEKDIEEIVGERINLPVENKSEHRPWMDYMTPFAAMVIDDWAPKDFKYGYDKLSMGDFLNGAA